MTTLSKKALQSTKFQPYWLDNPIRPDAEPCLQQDITTDLLIVGGGFTGLWSALQAKEQNPERDVVLIEANSIAIGASGRPGAILSTSLMHGMTNAERLFKDEMEELEALGKINMDEFKETIARYNIECDVEWTGELTVAVGKHGVSEVETEYKLYKRFGHDAHLLSQQQIQQEINSPLFQSGLWSKKRSGTINPAKLVWGLKKAARNLGVKIYENTPMSSSKDLEKQVVVITPNANIIANKVILATNAFTKHKTKISCRVAAIRDRIVVTEPLTEQQLADLGWKNRQGIYDTRTQLNYMRLTKDNRVLFGGRLGYFFNNNTDPQLDKTAVPYVRLVDSLYKTLPTLKGIKISHAWSGPIALTTRMAMHFQHYHKGKMVYVGGYSGFGVTASRFAAKMVLAIVDNEDIPGKNLSFTRTQPLWLPPEPFRWIGSKITMYALDTCDEKKGWRIPWLKFVDWMGFPLTP
ncbi:FAD-dependent oxidoreductase [Psychrosphaera aquimarina]|uniref:FAD-dependent oxidoreductase n=1 Tax=Psychrosphaera aquimarina TaxID=2044854 RepID=A0ABU3R1S6_9GAMM|nr:FAD-dependent oxidoreductase [Psychrosphaera aquimarina]MDU0113243.1 FAD-dependent oxidoreductase [Psychrosphaera aquimarina]